MIDLMSGAPQLASPPCAGIQYTLGGDEHGILTDVPPGTLPVGAQVQLVPSHCDPTVNLFDTFYGVRDGVVEQTFTIDARGW